MLKGYKLKVKNNVLWL